MMTRPRHPRGGERPPTDLMPHDPDAERVVLGAILDTPQLLDVVANQGRLVPQDFRVLAHELIYRTMLALRDGGAPAEMLLVIDAVEADGKTEEVGGASVISDLPFFTATYAPGAFVDPLPYARRVKRHAVRRHRLELAQRLAQAAADDDEDRTAQVVAALTAETGKEGEPRYKLWSVQELLDQPRPEPLIDGILALNTTSILYGPSGAGKSALLLDQMACVSLGVPWQGHASTGGHVVYVCAEGQAFLGERLEAVMLVQGVQDLPRLHIIPVPTQLLEPSTVPDLLTSFTAQLDAPPVWIVVDTLSQTTLGANENDPSEMRDYTGAMARLKDATGAHVMAVHHTGKNEELGARGASSLKGNVDAMLEVRLLSSETDAEEDGISILHCDKQRGRWPPFADISFTIYPQGLDEHCDRTGPALRLVPSTPTDLPRRRRHKRGMPDSWRQVLSVLGTFPNYTAQYRVWQDTVGEVYGVTHGTFQRAVDFHLDREHVSHVDSHYTLTTLGLKQVPRNGTTQYHEVPRNA